MPDQNPIFAVILQFDIFPATIANADIASLKALHTLKKCLYHLLVKFEQNCMVQTTRNLELFDKRPGLLKPTPFRKTFL